MPESYIKLNEDIIELNNKMTEVERQMVFYQVFTRKISLGDGFFKIIDLEKRREKLLK